MKRTVWIAFSILSATVSLTSCATIEGWFNKDSKATTNKTVGRVPSGQDSTTRTARDGQRARTDTNGIADRKTTNRDSLDRVSDRDSRSQERDRFDNRRYENDRNDTQRTNRSGSSGDRYADSNRNTGDRSNQTTYRSRSSRDDRNDERYPDRYPTNDRYDRPTYDQYSSERSDNRVNRSAYQNRRYDDRNLSYGTNRDQQRTTNRDYQADSESSRRDRDQDYYRRERTDLADRVAGQIDALDRQLTAMQTDAKNAERKDRKDREDRIKSLRDKRGQLIDSYYKVQRSNETDFRKVRRETNRLVDEVEEMLEMPAEKAGK